jgi:hypothetical protein
MQIGKLLDKKQGGRKKGQKFFSAWFVCLG